MTSTEPRDPQTGDFSESVGAVESTLTDVLHVARRRRLLVAAIATFAVSVSLALSALHDPVYRAEAVVSVQPKGELGGVQGIEELPNEVLNTVAREDLLKEAVERAGWNAGISEFKKGLDAEGFTGRGGQGGLRVRFSWREAEEAARAANAYAAVFVERAEGFSEERFAGGTLAAETSLQSKARTPSSGYWLRLLLTVVGALLAGLLAGVAAALGLEGRSRGWRSVRDVEIALKVPVIGVVPEYSLFKGEDGP